MKPEIILFCSGGIVQSVSANIDIKVIVLDRDIFEDSAIEKEGNEFDDRAYEQIHIETDPDKWGQFKEKERQEWNEELDTFTHESEGL